MGKKEKRVGIIDKNQKLKTKYKKPIKIYILHGWTYDISKWDPLLTMLKKNGVEVMLLNIPGLTAPLNTPWTLDDYVNWLNEQTKNEQRLVILGHSNGGRIALAFSLKYPERVSQLFLIDSAGIFHNELLLRLKRVTFKSVAKLGKKIAPETLRPFIYKLAKEHDYEKANPILQKTMRNLIAINLQPQLKKITTKTTIVWGEHDKITPFQDALTMHLLIKNSRLFPIMHAKHSPQFTHPEEVAKIVIDSVRIA